MSSSKFQGANILDVFKDKSAKLLIVIYQLGGS